MKKLLMIACALLGYAQAKKTKITLYNESNETILVSIDTMPQRPLAKSTIRPQEAKNFFLSALTAKQPYYFTIESSSELEPKLFNILVDPMKHEIILKRKQLVLGTLPSLILNDFDRFIKIAYHGSMRPEIPEVTFMR